MTSRRDIEEAEAPVKGWQLEATQKQVDTHDKLITGIDGKLDTIINLMNTRPTNEQVNDKIKTVKAEMQAELKNAIEKQDLKYSPIVKNNKTLIGLLLTSGVSLIGSLIILIVGAFR